MKKTILIAILLAATLLLLIGAPGSSLTQAELNQLAYQKVNKKGYCISDFDGDGVIRFSTQDVQSISQSACDQIGGQYRLLPLPTYSTRATKRRMAVVSNPSSAAYKSGASSVTSANISSTPINNIIAQPSSVITQPSSAISEATSSAGNVNISTPTSQYSSAASNYSAPPLNLAVNITLDIPGGLGSAISGIRNLGPSNYRPGNICHHQAEKLRLAVEAAGYDGTFTSVGEYHECKVQVKKLGIWIPIGSISVLLLKHAITDIHFSDGKTAWIDPTMGLDPVDIGGDDGKVNTMNPNDFSKGAQPGTPGVSIKPGKLPSSSYEPYIDPEVEDPAVSPDGKSRVICTNKGKFYSVFDDKASAMKQYGEVVFPKAAPSET